MEFATEMIIKASLVGGRISEVPITLHPDGRTSHPPHLKTFRDGWRTLRFFLMCSPRRLFLLPGLVLLVLGLAGYTIAMPGLTIAGMTFDAHTLLFSSLAVICGSQSMFVAALAKTFAMTEGVLPHDARVARFSRILTLERGLVLGVATAVVGGVMLLSALNEWRVQDFGHLDYAVTMRVVVPGVTLERARLPDDPGLSVHESSDDATPMSAGTAVRVRRVCSYLRLGAEPRSLAVG